MDVSPTNCWHGTCNTSGRLRESGAGPRNRIGKGTERYWTHQIFDVTNPKKVGGSTTGHAAHPTPRRRMEATPRRSRRYEASVSRMLNGTSRQIWT